MDLFFYLSKSSIIWVVLLTFNRSKKSKKCVKNRNSEEFTQPLSQKKPCFQNFHVDLFFCLSKSSIIWVDSTGVSIFVVILVILFNQLYLQLLRRQCCLKRSGALDRKPKCKVESMAMSMGGPASAMGCSNIWTHIRPTRCTKHDCLAIYKKRK